MSYWKLRRGITPILTLLLPTCPLHDLDSSANQLTKPNLWDGAALPIFLFGTNEFVDIDTSNILTSLLRIANFIQNRNIKGKIEKNIPVIARFS